MSEGGIFGTSVMMFAAVGSSSSSGVGGTKRHLHKDEDERLLPAKSSLFMVIERVSQAFFFKRIGAKSSSS